MRKTVLAIWLVVLVGAVCAWAKPQPEQSEIIMEIDRDAGEVGICSDLPERNRFFNRQDRSGLRTANHDQVCTCRTGRAGLQPFSVLYNTGTSYEMWYR